MNYEQLIKKAYENFNSRDIDAVFSTMNPDVDWPNGWEGGYVKGYDEIRDYWTRQWSEINPSVKPVGFHPIAEDQLEVQVHQLAKDLQGNVIYDGMLKHIYTFENGLIQRMDIESSEN